VVVVLYPCDKPYTKIFLSKIPVEKKTDKNYHKLISRRVPEDPLTEEALRANILWLAEFVPPQAFSLCQLRWRGEPSIR